MKVEARPCCPYLTPGSLSQVDPCYKPFFLRLGIHVGCLRRLDPLFYVQSCDGMLSAHTIVVGL